MDNLKLRAWIEAEKRFIYCDDSDDNYLGTFFTTIKQIEKLSGKKVPVDQSTGLLDKNDKDIYTGDIVKEFGEWNQEYYTEVRLREGMFLPLVKVEEGYNAIDRYDEKLFEVIGNIYENPELLN